MCKCTGKSVIQMKQMGNESFETELKSIKLALTKRITFYLVLFNEGLRTIFPTYRTCIHPNNTAKYVRVFLNV